MVFYILIFTFIRAWVSEDRRFWSE